MDASVAAALIGASVAFAGTIGIEAFKARRRRRVLLRAIRDEAFDLLGFIQAKSHVLDDSIRALGKKTILPGQQVRHPSTVYRTHLSEVAAHLRREHRNRLHFAYEVARVLDLLMEEQEEDIIRIGQVAPQVNAFDVVATKLREVKGAAERAIPLLRAFLNDSREPFRWHTPPGESS